MKQNKYCILTPGQMTHQVTCFRQVCYALHRPQNSKRPVRFAVARSGVMITLLKPSGYWKHQQVQCSWIVPSSHGVFTCFVFISELTATFTLYGLSVFITEMESVYSEVRTGSLAGKVNVSFLKVWGLHKIVIRKPERNWPLYYTDVVTRTFTLVLRKKDLSIWPWM